MTDIPILDAPEPAPAASPSPKRTIVRRKNARRATRRTAAEASRAGVASTEAAVGRAAPAREPEDGQEPVTRLSLEERQQNQFDLPQHRKKMGRDYQWLTISVMQQPVDGAVLMDAHQAGWRPERTKDWPELMPEGTSPDAPVERFGMRLMGRPDHLSHEALRETYDRARKQEKDRMAAVSTGGTARPGEESISNIRGVVPRGAQLDVQLAIGGAS